MVSEKATLPHRIAKKVLERGIFGDSKFPRRDHHTGIKTHVGTGDSRTLYGPIERR